MSGSPAAGESVVRPIRTPPRAVSVSAAGWAALVVAVVGLGLGVGLGWAEFLVVGLSGALVVVVAALFLVGRRPGAVAISVLERQVVAGGTATVVVCVTGDGGRAQRAQDAELPVGDVLQSIRLPAVDAGETREVLLPVPAGRRGVVQLGPVTLVRRDPFGFARRESARSGEALLFVHPPIAAIAVATSGLLRDLEGIATPDLTDSDIAFHALRPYVSGDDRRHIHWKSTAKTGSFLVRQFEQTRRSHLIVLQSLAADDYGSDEEFELAVSAVGSIGARAIADGTSLSVYAGAPRTRGEAGRLRTRGRRELLDDLSGIDPAPGATSVTALARTVGEQAPDASLVFLVCGSTVPARRLRAAASHFAPGVEVVAVVVAPEAPVSLVRIEALRILRIGYLDDLVRALARAGGA
ncbi:DUF58 domain-containing protein [Herbiconiux sp. CPCC 205716]|uniref:DUF58 domain-containing protein n=1 Tax=Herbiconiux gentiana TaxID=2970912 RepID=A0ABT2GB22_9MICO|nr:DUF58 domain-containing protein [Herbiconiux gentiana]MCS5713395.1 DUF58 domain-containing protein [Herbiconiux gentiana]